MADFKHRAAYISVDHPGVVQNYKAAQTIAVRGARGDASTEELRNAVVHYRALFDELLEVRQPKEPVAPATSGGAFVSENRTSYGAARRRARGDPSSWSEPIVRA